MSLIGRIHGDYVFERRVRRLCDYLAELMPREARVLDVGCGDGLLAYVIGQTRPDICVEGIEVLIRRKNYIPIKEFDGQVIPYGNRSFDVVMFVDVLHHTENPMLLLREGVRVGRQAILMKDHTLEGFLAGTTLRLMDHIGNARHGVALPYSYWPREKWIEAFEALGLKIGVWVTDLRLYPWPADYVFGRGLHFIARLDLS